MHSQDDFYKKGNIGWEALNTDCGGEQGVWSGDKILAELKTYMLVEADKSFSFSKEPLSEEQKLKVTNFVEKRFNQLGLNQGYEKASEEYETVAAFYDDTARRVASELGFFKIKEPVDRSELIGVALIATGVVATIGTAAAGFAVGAPGFVTAAAVLLVVGGFSVMGPPVMDGIAQSNSEEVCVRDRQIRCLGINIHRHLGELSSQNKESSMAVAHG